MFRPLNPLLYSHLVRIFGSVRVHNQGAAMVAKYGLDVFQGIERLLVLDPGEYYAVSCDRCNDTRYRLWINHRWGVRDEQGRRNLWLATCYNEYCYAQDGAAYDLLDKLNTLGPITHAQILPGTVAMANRPAALPGVVMPLHRLPPEHSANAYLAGRFFDPERLGRFYGVGYCAQSFYYLARNRIIVPIYLHGKLRGWQSRHIGDDLDFKAKDPNDLPTPKWFTDPNMHKNQVLYNYDNAIGYRTGVVVEGCSSCWGFGPMSVATLGSSFSQIQARLLISGFKDHSLVWLWDPDVLKDPAKVKHIETRVIPWMTGQFRNGFAMVWLPEGYDPGNMDRAVMRQYVAEEAAKQGVTVDWRKR